MSNAVAAMELLVVEIWDKWLDTQVSELNLRFRGGTTFQSKDCVMVCPSNLITL